MGQTSSCPPHGLVLGIVYTRLVPTVRCLGPMNGRVPEGNRGLVAPMSILPPSTVVNNRDQTQIMANFLRKLLSKQAYLGRELIISSPHEWRDSGSGDRT